MTISNSLKTLNCNYRAEGTDTANALHMHDTNRFAHNLKSHRPYKLSFIL